MENLLITTQGNQLACHDGSVVAIAPQTMDFFKCWSCAFMKITMEPDTDRDDIHGEAMPITQLFSQFVR